MLINELSKRTGVTAHTIRFYEKSGLIKGKRYEQVKSNNYFHYDEEAIERLKVISEAKAAGFTINEISQLIDACFMETYTKEQKLDLLDKKLESLEQRVIQIKQMKEKINEFRKEVLSNEW
jgi:MerR family copper efflux transcriptional regulator